MQTSIPAQPQEMFLLSWSEERQEKTIRHLHKWDLPLRNQQCKSFWMPFRR